MNNIYYLLQLILQLLLCNGYLRLPHSIFSFLLGNTTSTFVMIAKDFSIFSHAEFFAFKCVVALYIVYFFFQNLS